MKKKIMLILELLVADCIFLEQKNERIGEEARISSALQDICKLYAKKKIEKKQEEWEELLKYTSRSKPRGTIWVDYEKDNGEKMLIEGIRKIRVGKRNKPYSQEC